MNLLLDTHIFIWWDIAKKNLSAQRTQMLQDKKNTLFLSLASIWEMQIKIQIGKFGFVKPLPDIIKEQKTMNNLQILPITTKHIYELENCLFITKTRLTAL